MNNKIFLISIILVIIFSSVLFAQNSEKQIHFSLNTNYNFTGNEFRNYWKSNMGFGGEFRFDHPIGELGIGLSFMRFDKKIDLTKEFDGIDYYILYRRSINLIKSVNFSLGFNAGIFEFGFDDDDDIQDEAERIEREFAINLVTGVSFQFMESLNADFKTSYQHIYTKKKIELFYFSFGVTKSFSSPDWLGEFFE